MESVATHNVVVHKANIPLMAGESVRDFTRALSDAGRQHIKKAHNLPNKGADVYMIEAFSKSAVFEVYRFGEGTQPQDRMRFYATEFTRKDNGSFEFTPTSEVRRVTRFEPVKTPVTKNGEMCAGGMEMSKCACKSASGTAPTKCVQTRKGLEVFDQTTGDLRVFGNEQSQWQETGKSFWHGAL